MPIRGDVFRIDCWLRSSIVFFFSSRRRHTRWPRDWSSDVCSSDLLLRPTAGTATVAGYDVVTQSQQVRRSIGYVSQVGSTFSGAYAGDEVVDHGMLYGLSRKDATVRGQALFEQLQLEGLWRRMPKNMSGGQKRRLDIVMGLIHEPTFFFNDTATT